MDTSRLAVVGANMKTAMGPPLPLLLLLPVYQELTVAAAAAAAAAILAALQMGAYFGMT